MKAASEANAWGKKRATAAAYQGSDDDKARLAFKVYIQILSCGSDFKMLSWLTCRAEGDGSNDQRVTLRSGESIARVPGVALVYTNTYTGIPPAFTRMLANVPALHEVVVFITIRSLPLSTIRCLGICHSIAGHAEELLIGFWNSRRC